MGGLKRVIIVVIIVSIISLINTKDIKGQEPCSVESLPIDLVFVIEGSVINLGTGESGFRKFPEYLLFKFDPAFDIAGVISYDNDIDFITHPTFVYQVVNNSIYSVDFNGNSPNINIALETAFDELLTNGRSGAFKNIILVSSGNWTPSPSFDYYIQKSKNLGIPINTIMPSFYCNTFFIECSSFVLRFHRMILITTGYFTAEPNSTNLDAMYEFIVNGSCDRINPKIDFGVGVEANNTKLERDFIFVNVSIIELSPVNITFSLYNTTSLLNKTTYSLLGIEYYKNLSINFTSLGPGYYFYNVSITDRSNLKNQTPTRGINLTKKRNPVLLVHGYCSSIQDTWGVANAGWEKLNFEQELKSRGFDVYILEIVPKPVNEVILNYVPQLMQKIEEVKRQTGAKKVDVVAHSMGGLITRWYIQKMGKSYKNDINQLIMIATPNHGSALSDLEGLNPDGFGSYRCLGSGGKVLGQNAATDMHPKSTFMAELNYNQKKFDINTWLVSQDIIGSAFGVKYSTLGGTGRSTLQYERIRIVSGGIDRGVKAVSFLDSFGDGVVALNSLKLTNVGCNQYPGLDHSTVHENITLLNKVVDILKNRNLNQGDDCFPLQRSPHISLSPLISDTITQGQEKIYDVLIDSGAINLTFGLIWDDNTNDLGFSLIDPNGNHVGPGGIGARYNDFGGAKTYVIEYPVFGVWKMNITGNNIQRSTESFSARSSFVTDISFEVQELNNNYTKNPGDVFNFVSFLFNDTNLSSPILNADIKAEIVRPDNMSENITLYDDGLHNDFNSNDGVYGNSYSNTNIEGVYQVQSTANASASIDGNIVKILRYATQIFWIEDYPDLVVNKTSISITPSGILDENNLANISIKVFNTGKKKGSNVTLFLFDEVNQNISSIANINLGIINPNSFTTVLFEWNTTTPGGNHTIYAQASTFDSFELDYSNNEANLSIFINSGTISYCRDIDISGNYIFLSDITYNNNLYCIKVVKGNTVIDCQGYSILGSGIGEGIKIINSNTVTIRNCVIKGFGLGLNFTNSSNNIITNNLFNNTKNAVDDGINNWNANTWSDYLGNDTDGNGRGDQNIPHNSQGGILNGGDYTPIVPINNKPIIKKYIPVNTQLEYNSIVNIIFNVTTIDLENNIFHNNWYVDGILENSSSYTLSYNFYDVKIYNVTYFTSDIKNAFTSFSWFVNVTTTATGGGEGPVRGGGGSSPFVKKKLNEAEIRE